MTFAPDAKAALNVASIPLSTPTLDRSSLSTDYSIPLHPRIEGTEAYQKKLHTFCKDLLSDLIIENPTYASQASKQAGKHLSCLVHLIHSLAYVASRPASKEWLALSMDNNTYANGQFKHLSYPHLKRMVEMLSAQTPNGAEANRAYIELLPGFYDRTAKFGYRTRIRPMRRLEDRLAKAGLIWASHPARPAYHARDEFLFLKTDDENKIALSRAPTASEAIIPLLNQAYKHQRVEIAYESYRQYEDTFEFSTGYSKLNMGNRTLFRQFKFDEQSGGRLYGHEVQNYPKHLRRLLTFNGQPTVEYDYKACQLHIAYSLHGLTAPEGDPYVIPGFTGTKNRMLFKGCFLRAVGLQSADTLHSSFSHAINEMLGRYPKPGLAQAMAKAFWSHHSGILELAGSQAWRKLQYAESEIMLEVLAILYDQGIVAVPIHDSAIVAAEHEKALEAAMVMAVGSLSSQPAAIKSNYGIDEGEW